MSSQPTQPRANWRMTGNERECAYLAASDVMQIHEALVAHAAGTEDAVSPPGLRSEDLLESAISRPATSFGGVLKYKSAEDAAAALMHSIVLNHPFHNGNKRTAVVAVLVFLDRNNFILESTQDDLYDLVVDTAAHHLVDPLENGSDLADAEVMRIAQRLGKRSRLMRREERPMTAQKLHRRLRQFGCSITEDGSQWIVRREVTVHRALHGTPATTMLEHKLRIPTAGSDVSKASLRLLRTQLHLDAEHLVDSDRFYSTADVANDFISESWTLLRRLAAI